MLRTAIWMLMGVGFSWAVMGSDGARTENPGSERDNAVETLALLEKRVKKFVTSGVKMALPYVMSSVTEVQLTAGCTNGFFKLMRGVMDINDWAVKMLDAFGKPSSGILQGTPTALGDYDECLDIAVPKRTRRPQANPQIDFRGQYCMVQIHIPQSIRQAAMEYQAGNRSSSVLANSKTFLKNLVKIAPLADIADYRLGVCIPSTCTLKDLQGIANDLTKKFEFQISATALRCEVKPEESLRIEQIIILSIIGVFGILLCIGTLTETIICFRTTEKINELYFERQRYFIQCLVAFSVGNNIRKLISLKSVEYENIACVRGLKFISVCLYVIVSTYATPHDFHFFKYRSVFQIYKFMDEWWFAVFANASAGVDTFFFLAGLELTYRIWKKAKVEQRIQINIPKFIIKWYCRFTTAQLLVIGLFLCLPLIGSGPIWADIVTPKINNCRERWWLNALSINIFWSSNDSCLIHTWLICCMMHIFLAAAIVLWILSKWTAVGIFVNIILILGSCIAIAMVTLIDNLPPAPAFYFLSFLNLKSIWEKLFIQAYDHIAPFCIGVLSGYFIATYAAINLRKIVVVLGWCLTFACEAVIICGLYGYRHGERMDLIVSAIYASLHRIGWSLGIAWIVFACTYGYGGFVNDILSWKLLIPLERLSSFMYLLHPLVLYLHGGQLREKLNMAHIDQAMYAAAYIVYTVAISTICHICFYSPFAFLEKSIWGMKDNSPLRKRSDVAKLKDGVSNMLDICLEKGRVRHLVHSSSSECEGGNLALKT